MSKRDEYIAHNQGMVDAYRSASLYVPAATRVMGGNVREDLELCSRMAAERVEWASKLTNREFNAEAHKP